MNMDNPGLLLHKIGAMMEHISDSLLFNEFGIGFSQFKIMYVLMGTDNIAQKDIASSLGQTEPSVSRQIKLLKQAALITAQKSDTDKKLRLISLTPKGRRQAEEAFALLNLHYTPILSVLSEHQMQEFVQRLAVIHDRLEASCHTS